MEEKTINVLLVDDHVIVRSGVQVMLESDPDIRVTGQAESAQEALALLKNASFDVALIDISLPGRNGIELLKILRTDYPRLAVLMLSAYSEDIYAIRAIRYGASGYLTKDCPAGRLIAAVKTAAVGGKSISPSVGEKLADMVSGKTGEGFETLSDREIEVLKLIAKGVGLKEIASSLHLSPHTITTYRARILKKTGINGNANLAIFAKEAGLIN